MTELTMFITGGLGLFFILVLIGIGLWSSFGDREVPLESPPPSDYDESMKYLKESPTPGPITKAALEQKALERLENGVEKLIGMSSDAYLLELVEAQKYGKIIFEGVTLAEAELARREVYGEIKNETKEEKAISRRIKSLLRGND